MKYSLPKKIIYSIIVAVLLVGLVLTAFFGLNGKGYGSTYDIDLGLDLAGGVSITYQIKEDNFTSQDVEDTIYKLQKRVEGKSTESQVYKEGDNRITVEIPGVTDANEILKELGTPGSLEFLDSTGYSAFSQGNDYTPLLTGSDVKAAQAYTDTNSSEDTPYGVQLTFTDDGATKFYDATSANIGNRIYIVYDGEVVSAPNVKTAISGGTATITGMESFDEADNLATYIRVGSIPLTLPGIAGIILGIGMAVDGNVIIYTRIREEIGAGKSVESAIFSGYNKATSSIVDGNVTTLIAALVLYIFGTGPVKGFATTLAVGNIVSIFTSLVITKVIMKLLYNFGIRDAKWYGKNVYRKTLDVLSIKKWAAIGSAVVIAAGIITMAVQAGLGNRALNFSLEFVGGSTTTFTFDKEYTAEEIEDNIIPVIRDAAGITEVQQQKVADSTQVSFKTSDLSLEQREAIENAVTAKYPIKDGTIVETDTISSSVSATVKRDAILSVILATICMLIYIFVRFRDIRFALAAVLALLHDVLVVIAFYAFARIPVGTTFIACMLTIVGYSINGTIIIFDRIREQLKTANSKTNITELVNSSITSTMSRTVYTSITTLIMLIVLFIMGVTSVKEFTLPLIVGIVVGAYSSVCLTSAMWYVMGGKKRGVVEENNKKAASKKEVFEDGSQV